MNAYDVCRTVVCLGLLGAHGACSAGRPPEPMSLALEATLECAVRVAAEEGFEEEYATLSSLPSAVTVRLGRADGALTVTIVDYGDGILRLGFTTPPGVRAVSRSSADALSMRIRNRCLPR